MRKKLLAVFSAILIVCSLGMVGMTASALDSSKPALTVNAVNFANIEWAKIKRDDGHTLELKTVGSDTIREGQWCRVYLPSFNLDQYMYITRVSQSDGDSGWECSLSLTDYPPSFGEYQEESSEDEEEEDIEDVDADADVDTGEV